MNTRAGGQWGVLRRRMLSIACVSIAAVALLAAACGDDNAAGPATAEPTASGAAAAQSPPPSATRGASPAPAVASTAPAPPATTAARSSGCGVALPPDVIAGRTVVRTLVSSGLTRSYRLHFPPTGAGNDPRAVVLNFHGLGSSALEQELYSGFDAVSDREGFVLVTPDGTGEPRAWGSFASIASATDDVQFTRDLLDALARDLCLDAKRVYATGLSNGAFMSSRLACVLSDRFAAVAPVAGVYYPTEACGTPVPLLAFHGTEDPVVPFEAGRIFGLLLYAGAREGTAAWAKANGCGATPAVERLSAHVTRESYPECAAETALVVIDGGGHTWPGAIAVPRLGPTTDEIRAAELIWAFFAANPKK